MNPKTHDARGTETEAAVRSLVIPLDRVTLLVPNALVSEVASIEEILPNADSKAPWVIGRLAWRGLLIPVLAFERLLGRGTGAQVSNSRAIVLNTLQGNQRLPFIAVLSRGIPRLISCTAHDVVAANQTPPDGVLAVVNLRDGEVAHIPDIDRIEQLLAQQNLVVEHLHGQQG